MRKKLLIFYNYLYCDKNVKLLIVLPTVFISFKSLHPSLSFRKIILHFCDLHIAGV